MEKNGKTGPSPVKLSLEAQKKRLMHHRPISKTKHQLTAKLVQMRNQLLHIICELIYNPLLAPVFDAVYQNARQKCSIEPESTHKRQRNVQMQFPPYAS